eukprot:6055879-Lingulodinium_polyedra.AAC.1
MGGAVRGAGAVRGVRHPPLFSPVPERLGPEREQGRRPVAGEQVCRLSPSRLQVFPPGVSVGKAH